LVGKNNCLVSLVRLKSYLLVQALALLQIGFLFLIDSLLSIIP